MDKRRSITTLVAMLLIVGAAASALALGARPNLGLDLQGGISAIYSPQLPEGEEEPDDYEALLDETIEVIRARIDSLGVAEPDISRQGVDILVQLPGVTDADRLREIIGTTAQLDFRPVIDVFQPGDPGYDEGPDCTAPVDERRVLGEQETGLVCGAVDAVAEGAEQPLPPKYEVGPTALTGDRIDDARPTLDQQGYSVALDLDRAGGQAFAAITADLACERDQGRPGLLAIVMDNAVESAPNMAQGVLCGVGITGGTAQITTGATAEGDGEDEANDLALILRAGALPLTLEPSTFATVSATLGEDSLRSGILAGGIGLVLVGIWLVFFYKALGVVALAGLAVFGVLVGGVIAGLGEVAGFALTLAGIAGIIVAIGITADSSIIYFERIRDEVNLGKTPRTAVRKGFTSAFRTNLAGNTVTLAAATILYLLAIGPVRGFALMLGIATLIDLLILGLFTRPVVELLARTKLITRRSLRAVERPAAGTPVEASGGVR
ncbi:protein translocase subunit SecD [Nitriliruptor alkaliphilus]|uniref:protein translocase subunit SecD n=1 Tax=Nitriliruptor alkaliphilus TaxID=427918 RepID=UPI000698F174|nr:protein translocase subunit SecD [Nitriliruptor alkaliphilus]